MSNLYNEIRFVARVHFQVYQGKQLPIEIGVASVLKDGEQERDRQQELWTIFHLNLFKAKDERINRVAHAK